MAGHSSTAFHRIGDFFVCLSEFAVIGRAVYPENITIFRKAIDVASINRPSRLPQRSGDSAPFLQRQGLCKTFS